VFTLVPSNFFDPSRQREALSEVAKVEEGSKVEHIAIPQYDAILVYSVDGDSVVSAPPVIAEILQRLPSCPEYNKILCCFRDGRVNIAIAQGKSLLVANSFEAQDFTTAEYYIFLCIKSQQINPEVSTICWMGVLSTEEKMSLYRYFKSVSLV